jgi:hypothetical protein
MLSPITIMLTVAPLTMSTGGFSRNRPASRTFAPTYPSMNARTLDSAMPTSTIGS